MFVRGYDSRACAQPAYKVTLILIAVVLTLKAPFKNELIRTMEYGTCHECAIFIPKEKELMKL